MNSIIDRRLKELEDIITDIAGKAEDITSPVADEDKFEPEEIWKRTIELYNTLKNYAQQLHLNIRETFDTIQKLIEKARNRNEELEKRVIYALVLGMLLGYTKITIQDKALLELVDIIKAKRIEQALKDSI